MERKRRNRTHDLSNVKKRREKALLVSRRFHLKIIVAVDCAARRQTSASCIKLRMREREREREGEERKENFYQVFQAVDRLYPLVRGPDHAQICRCPVMKVRFSDVRDIRRKPPR